MKRVLPFIALCLIISGQAEGQVRQEGATIVRGGPELLPSQNVPVRCVNAAGTAFEACGGGGSGDTNVTNNLVSEAIAIRCVNTAGDTFVECGIGGAGSTDTDDGSIAGGQSVGLGAALNKVWSGAAWVRLTQGQATMASSLPVTIASNQSDIQVSPPDDLTATGTFTAGSQTVTLSVEGRTGGTWYYNSNAAASMDIALRGTVDGVNWIFVGFVNMGTFTSYNYGQTTTLVGANTQGFRFSTIGLQQIQLMTWSYTAGSADVAIRLSVGDPPEIPNAVVVTSFSNPVNANTELADAVAITDGMPDLTVPIVGTAPLLSAGAGWNRQYSAGPIGDGNSGFTFPTSGKMLFNGTNYDRARSVINGMNTTGTGVQAVGFLGQHDDAAIGTCTENQFCVPRITVNRELVAALSYTPLPTGAGAVLDGVLSATTTAAAVGTGATTKVLVQNDPDNTVDVFCGNATTQSLQLKPGDGMSLEVSNLNLIYCKMASGTGNVNYVAR